MSHIPAAGSIEDRIASRPSNPEVRLTTPEPQDPARAADTTSMDGLLTAAREVLGMELAYLAEVHESELVLREVDGDTGAYGVVPGFSPAGDALVVPRDGRAAPRRSSCPTRPRSRRPPRTRSWPRPGSAPTPACRCAARTARCTGRSAASAAPRSRSWASATCATSTCSRGWQRGASKPRRARRMDRRAEVEAAAGQALLAALNARENYTAAHSEAVLELALDGGGRAGDRLRRRDVGRPGRAAARHRQGRRAGRDPAEAGPADRARVGRDARAPGDRRADRRRDRLALAPRAGCARRARALGRQRLPGRARRRGRPAREPHLLGLRRLARDDLGPPVPPGADARRRRAPSSSATPARSSARPPWRRSCACSTAAACRWSTARTAPPGRQPGCRRSAPTGRSRPSCGR